MKNWQRPKKPTYQKGRIVIHSDDGRLWDYTHYFKIIQRTVMKYNQFNPLRAGVFCPAINSGYVDGGWHELSGLPMMSWDMIKEIANKGGEILSHGKYHLFFDGTTISKPLSIGDTRIYYQQAQGQPREGFKFYITDGVNRDDFTVTSYTHLGGGLENFKNIDTPLSHSYSTNAKVYLHEESLERQINGIINDLNEHGIECKHQVNPWYNNSPVARGFLEQYFDSVITTMYDKTKTQSPSDVDLYDMRRTQDMRHYSFAEIDELLDDVIAKDSVAFVQNHGGDYQVTFDNLEYLVSQAMERGVRLVTHSEAVEYIKSQQV